VTLICLRTAVRAFQLRAKLAAITLVPTKIQVFKGENYVYQFHKAMYEKENITRPEYGGDRQFCST
jgi:hypothetical protein